VMKSGGRERRTQFVGKMFFLAKFWQKRNKTKDGGFHRSLPGYI
jgi:hypothetical protein